MGRALRYIPSTKTAHDDRRKNVYINLDILQQTTLFGKERIHLKEAPKTFEVKIPS